MDAAPKARTVFVTVRKNGDGTLSWSYDNNPGQGDVLDVTTACEIVYTLRDSPGFQFCEPPDAYKDPNSQLYDPNYSQKTATVIDSDTVQSKDPMGVYLYVKGMDDVVYQSPDPEIVNTDGP